MAFSVRTILGVMGTICLTDVATNVTYELQGPGLDDLVGASVEVTGSTFDATPAEGASKVVSVSDIHQMPMSEIRGNRLPRKHSRGWRPAPSGETVPSTVQGQKSAPIRKRTAPPEANNTPAPAPLPNTTIRRRSSSSWPLRLEPSSGWLWAWAVVSHRPSARSRFSLG